MDKETIVQLLADGVISNEVAERYFPELKESRDERIRQFLIRFVRYYKEDNDSDDFSKEDCLAWLEKQGEKLQGKSALEAIKEEKVDNANKIEPKDYSSIDPYFFKATDKAESRFKVGYWVVFNNKHQSIYQVEKIEDGYYILRHTHGGTFRVCVLHDESLRLWNISDVKGGDVLEFGDHGRLVVGIVSYVNKTTGKVDVNCLLENNNFKVGNYYNLDTIKPHPATKEQRELLFQKIKDAGYEWNEIKNELKEIEQKSVTMSLDEAIEHCKEKSCGNNACALEHKQLEKWLTELKELKEQKHAWSEKDDYNLQCMIAKVTSDIQNGNVGRNQELIDWLKSLKERYTWKPSEKQIKAIRLARSFVTDDFSDNPTLSETLIELEKQLKNLKG